MSVDNMQSSDGVLSISLQGKLPERWQEGIQAVKEDLGYVFQADGIKVNCFIDNKLSVKYDGESIRLGWATTVQFYRALSLIPIPLCNCDIVENPCFKNVGPMFDMSRNAVLKPESLKYFLRKMALMGLNFGMLYTEDTYEVPEQPYFGYKRGRYTEKEIREIDDYADIFGIELCPCIQTLGHLKKMLHWPEYAQVRDNDNVILADDERTYTYLEQMIRAASAPYRSKKIHLGMDEAHGVGLGAHMRRYGYEPPIQVIQRHLKKVLEITEKYNLQPMVWSDMFFRLDSETNDYYDDTMPSQKAIDSVPKGITLFYWDYYHDKQEIYEQMFNKHAALKADIAFAGGIWTWSGPVPDYNETYAIYEPALNAAKEANVNTVVATLWGDDGAETNLVTSLLGLQMYGEFAYKGKTDYENIDARFKKCCGGNAEAFRSLAEFNQTSRLHGTVYNPSNLAKLMLYQDLFVQLFETDTEGVQLSAHYALLEEKMRKYVESEKEYTDLFIFYRNLANFLKYKCEWHEKAGETVRSGNREGASELVKLIPEMEKALSALRSTWYSLWNSTNKPYGYEIIDLRLGGVEARIQTAEKRMKEFAKGECNDIPELSEKSLPYLRKSKELIGSTNWMEYIVSASGYDTI